MNLLCMHARLQVIFCEFAVGTFRRYVATEYCMSVADVTISGLHFDDETFG